MYFIEFQVISMKFVNFQKFRHIRESGKMSKMLDAALNPRNFSTVHYAWPKLNFFSKPNDSVVCGKFQVIAMQYDE